MAFQKLTCTKELLESLHAPIEFWKSALWNIERLFGSDIHVDTDRKALILALGTDRSTYPDWSYQVFIGSINFYLTVQWANTNTIASLTFRVHNAFVYTFDMKALDSIVVDAMTSLCDGHNPLAGMLIVGDKRFREAKRIADTNH